MDEFEFVIEVLRRQAWEIIKGHLLGLINMLPDEGDMHEKMVPTVFGFTDAVDEVFYPDRGRAK